MYRRRDKNFINDLLIQHSLNAMRKIVRRNMNAWVKFFPKHGPCWPVARALANAGLGRVEYCQVYCKSDHSWYGHYVVRAAEGRIIDVSGEYVCQDCPADRNAPYKGFIVYDEATHIAYPQSTVDWWAKKFKLQRRTA